MIFFFLFQRNTFKHGKKKFLLKKRFSHVSMKHLFVCLFVVSNPEKEMIFFNIVNIREGLEFLQKGFFPH